MNDFRIIVTNSEGKEVEIIGNSVRFELNVSPIIPTAYNYCSVLIKGHRGFNKPFIEVVTNKSADLAIDSKDGELIYYHKNGYWKIKSGEDK